MLQEEKEKLIFEEAPKILIPSKFNCERHAWHSDESGCPQCMQGMKVTANDLHNKINMPLAAYVNDDGVMQVVVNTSDERTLWATWKRMEGAINFVLNAAEAKRQATAIQPASASIMDKLRGN